MKAELLRKFDELLQNDDIMAVRPDVKELRDTWNRLTREEENAQHEQWKTVEHEEGEDFVFTPAPEDERFEALYAAYRERIAEHRARVEAEQKENLRQKKELLTRLETLIKEEENVGKAFEQFNEINDGWKAIGDVPGDAVRELNDGFQRLRDDFFYNINIYKELREHDLKINLRKKEELIELARQLTALEDIKEIEMLARSYQKQWSEIGPSPRETWKEVGDSFFGLIRVGYGKVQAHYDALRSQQEANLEARRELIRKVNEISALDISNHGTWNKKTEEVLELQKQWKDCGYVPKAEGEEVWKEFRAACDLFFERKNLYYRQRKDEYKSALTVKERLVKEANELKEETDWKKTTDKILKLQEQWKAAGSAGQSDERRLWGQFRAACDQFFEAKKAYFAGMGDRHDANKQEKEALITDLEGFELTGNRTVDMETLRGYQTRWNSIGHVAKADMKPLSERFFAILDAKWEVLKSNKIERNITNYKSRVDSLRESGSKDVGRERRLLREKIDRLKQRVLQYENNLNFFTGPGADEMKKGVERKIRAANDEIDEIKQKLRLFDEAN